MIKKILTILLLVLLTGCGQKFGADIATSTASTTAPVIPVIIEPLRYSLDDLSVNQVKDEFIEKTDQYTPNGLLYAQLLDTKISNLKVDKTTNYVSDVGYSKITKTDFEKTDLEWVNVITLYVRAKKDGKLTDRNLIALLKDEKGKELISFEFSREKLELGWTTKWDSYVGLWTPKDIANFDLDIISKEIGEPILISSVKLYVGQQRSIDDTFDAYNDGDLNGQGGWTGHAGYDIQGDVVQTGAKAVKIIGPGGGVWIQHTFTEEANGRQIFYMRAAQTNQAFSVYFFDGPRVGGLTMSYIRLNSDGNITHQSSAGGHIIQAYSADTWYKCEMEWSQTSPNAGKYRIRIDDGDWTSWYNGQESWSAIDMIDFHTVSGTCYWDSFGGESPPPPVVIPRRRMIITN